MTRKPIQRYLPFYSRLFWEGRHGLAALARHDCESALRLWRALADAGDPEAQYRLGLLHCSGECVQQDLIAATTLMTKAARQKHFSAYWWLKRAAHSGNAHAQYELGMMYLQGFSAYHDKRAGRKLLAAAAEQGHSEAQIEWGRQNIEGMFDGLVIRFILGKLRPNVSKAICLFQKAARSGNSRGKYFLGLVYETGAGVSVDFAKAFQLMSEAANENLIVAQLDLARYYWNGEVTMMDKKMAMQWFETAKENIHQDTDGDTCAVLANSYIEGWCCEPNIVKGYYWTAIAYRDNKDERNSLLRKLRKRMDHDQICQAKSLL